MVLTALLALEESEARGKECHDPLQEAQSPGVWLSQTNCQMGQSGHAAAKGSRGRFTGMVKKGGRTHENALNRRMHRPEASGSQDTDARGWLAGLSSLLYLSWSHSKAEWEPGLGPQACNPSI